MQPGQGFNTAQMQSTMPEPNICSEVPNDKHGNSKAIIITSGDISLCLFQNHNTRKILGSDKRQIP